MGTATPPAGGAGVAAGVRARLADLVEAEPSPAELALLLRLLSSFAAKAPAAADLLARLLHGGDPAQVRDQAHSLKGSSANIGATALAAFCATVEDRARAGVVTDPGAAADELRALVGDAVEAVRAVALEYERIAR